jgi:hypothetical protein
MLHLFCTGRYIITSECFELEEATQSREEKKGEGEEETGRERSASDGEKETCRLNG